MVRDKRPPSPALHFKNWLTVFPPSLVVRGTADSKKAVTDDMIRVQRNEQFRAVGGGIVSFFTINFYNLLLRGDGDHPRGFCHVDVAAALSAFFFLYRCVRRCTLLFSSRGPLIFIYHHLF